MVKGYLIYNRCDAEKNTWFIQHLIDVSKAMSMELLLLIKEECQFIIEHQTQRIVCKNQQLDEVDFVINRTRDSLISQFFESMNIRVFNSSFVTDVANHKGKSHVYFKRYFPCLTTTLLPKDSDSTYLSYPLVIKSVGGHGGKEVEIVVNEQHLESMRQQFSNNDCIIQEIASEKAVDIRVYVVGSKICLAMKREAVSGFKANFSLGGKASVVELDETIKLKLNDVLSERMYDFVGFDFIVDENQWYFNELEDVVGSRMVYEHTDIDMAVLYMQWIKKEIV